ncbi:MAG: hypothetical protein KDB22_10430 [Planctomycetales bacterium]|nr:hypothetical protein [Planctomycetales bacterium]
MPLSEAAQERISLQSRVLWENFESAHGGKYQPRNLLHPDNINAYGGVLLDFFDLCAQILIEDFEVVETNILWANLESLRPEKTKNRAVSWLHWQFLGNSLRINIVLDHECLLNAVPIQLQHRLRTKLILHEIGHLYHWGYLATQPGFTREALPFHESEAWWFCFAVLGYCSAMCACEKKNNPEGGDMPPIWEMV